MLSFQFFVTFVVFFFSFFLRLRIFFFFPWEIYLMLAVLFSVLLVRNQKWIYMKTASLSQLPFIGCPCTRRHIKPTGLSKQCCSTQSSVLEKALIKVLFKNPYSQHTQSLSFWKKVSIITQFSLILSRGNSSLVVNTKTRQLERRNKEWGVVACAIFMSLFCE